MIWRSSLPSTRIVTIRCGTDSLFQTSNSNWCTSLARIPASLHVCQESRQEALRYYKLRFGVAGPPKIFFNPEIDVLHFGPVQGFMASTAQYFTAMSLCDPSDLRNVRYLAIDHSVVGNGIVKGAVSPLTARILRQLPLRMPGLKGLIFVRSKTIDAPKHLHMRREIEENYAELQILIDKAIREVAGEFVDWEVPAWCTAKI